MPDHDEAPGSPEAGDDGAAGLEQAREAADRLERALERIATAAQAARDAPEAGDTRPGGDLVPEIAHRLDAVIAELRTALEGA